MMFPKRGKKSRTTGIQSLDRKLWEIFSKYIRTRDCKYGGLPGYGLCITCGKAHGISDMDAGHFIGRRHKATRFHEKNVNAQCRKCNRFESGEQYAHAKAIDSKWGPGTADMLYSLSRMPTKLTREWYEMQIEEYKKKLRNMLRGRG